MGKGLRIEVAAVNPLLGQKQGEAVRDYIVEKLSLAAEDFTLRNLPGEESVGLVKIIGVK